MGSRLAIWTIWTIWSLGLMLFLGAGSARATLISYQLSGATNVVSEPPRNVPIQGTATFDFQGSRVTLGI